MAKKVQGYLKLQIPAGGAANPSPQLDQLLGKEVLILWNFVKHLTKKQKDKTGYRLPVVLTIYTDKKLYFQ